jgi:2-oxo-4-hydroxy-4-carboxy-5-ureidoimidazoline decarboxylase
MIIAVNNLSEAAKLALICAHPDLGSKTKMAQDSTEEQSALGLDQLTPTEYEQFQNLNQEYKNKFNFPFIIAVKNHTKNSILQAFLQRLNNSFETEKQQALTEIQTIARFRLFDLVQ